MTFIMRHSMTGVAVADLLALLEVHMISPNLCKTSMKLIRQFFSKMRSKVVYHYYCGKCNLYIGISNEVKCHLCKEKILNYFIIVPVLATLTSIFACKNLRFSQKSTKITTN